MSSRSFPGFYMEIEKAKMPEVKFLKGTIPLYKWQKECAKEYAEAIKGLFSLIVNAPTGSGKTLLICYLICLLYAKNKKKTLIITPMKVIGNGFINDEWNFELLKGFKINGKNTALWSVAESNNLCREGLVEGGKTKRLLSFIRDDANAMLRDSVMICSYSTFVRAYDGKDGKDCLKKSGELHLLKDINLWVDEAHHIMNGGSDETCNELGKIANYFCKNGYNINLSSATFFRGNKAPIIPEDDKELFHKFILPYDRHFAENCKGLVFKYEFLLYEKDWIEPIRKAFREKMCPTLIFIPHPMHRAATMRKGRAVKEVVYSICDKKVPIVEDEHGMIVVERDGRPVRILDIVEEKGRDSRLKYFRKRWSEIDVVIGMNVPKEGFDWPDTQRIFIIGQKNSLNEILQQIGRGFRHHIEKENGKNPVEIYHVLPWVDSKRLNKTELRDNLNNFMKCVYSSLILETMVNPIKVKVVTVKNGKRHVKTMDIVEHLKKTFGEMEWLNLWEDIAHELADYGAKHGGDDNKKAYEQIIFDMLDRAGIEEYREAIKDTILAAYKRRTKHLFSCNTWPKNLVEGFNVEGLDVELVMKKNPYLGCLIAYSNNLCGAKDLRDFRRISTPYFKDYYKLPDNLKKFIKKHGKYPSRLSDDVEERQLASATADVKRMRSQKRRMETI